MKEGMDLSTTFHSTKQHQDHSIYFLFDIQQVMGGSLCACTFHFNLDVL